MLFLASLILIILIIFGLLIYILQRIIKQNVMSATKHLDELNEDYSKKEQEVNTQLEEAKTKSQQLIASAQEEAERLKMDIIKHAQDEQENIINEARNHAQEIIQQADKSRQLLLSELDDRIAKESVNKACELIQDTLPEQLKEIAHKQWVEDLIGQGFGGIDRLNLPDGIEEIVVISAFSLTEEQRRHIAKKLKDILGRDIKLKEQIDNKIVAGLIINIGSLVLDGSLKNKISKKAR